MKNEIYLKLVELIADATRTTKICVPSEDYYRRPEDWEGDTIKYVDPEHLISLLTDEINKGN